MELMAGLFNLGIRILYSVSCVWLRATKFFLLLGFVMNFISGPVISGFCSAAATTIIFSQIKIILGLKFRGSAFVTVVPGIFSNCQEISLWDAMLGIVFIVLLILLKV